MGILGPVSAYDKGIPFNEPAERGKLLPLEVGVQKKIKSPASTLPESIFATTRLLDLLPLSVFCCDLNGVIRQYNARLVKTLGYTPDQTHYDNAFHLHSEDGAVLPAEDWPMAEVLRSGQAVHDAQLILERLDGTRLAITANVEPIFDESGRLVGGMSCFQNTNAPVDLDRQPDHQEVEHPAGNEDQQFYAVLETLPVPIYTTDADGRITFCNKAATELCGRTPVPGKDKWSPFKTIYNAYGEPLEKENGPVARSIRQQPLPDDVKEIIGECDDGSRVRVQPVISLTYDRGAKVVGTVNVLMDVTAPHKAELESAHMSAIVSSSLDAIISKSLDGIVQTWNAGATEIFGYQPSEMIGQSITRIIPLERLHEEETILQRLRRGERIEHFETERIGKDGRKIDISLTVSPVRDRFGRVIGASKIAHDISERKKAEEVQRRLVKELNHRVKNTLATVQSLANQTARLSRSPTEFSASFSERIQALAQTHDLLTEYSWRGADLTTILRERVSLPVGDGRVEFSGPHVLLEPQPALHMALVLHELSANARKYGALSVPDGKLTVRWTIQTDGAPKVVLKWTERGGPTVSEPTSKGFGTTLIKRSLTAHDGHALLKYNASGVVCEIELPLSAGAKPEKNAAQSPSIQPSARSEMTSKVDGEPLRVLVVEDEATIAFDLVSDLSELGCIIVGPAATLVQAHDLISSATFDIALLDANLNGDPIEGIASSLTEQGIPFAFLSGYGREELPQAFNKAPLVRKPFTFEEVTQVLSELTKPAKGNMPPES